MKSLLVKSFSIFIHPLLCKPIKAQAWGMVIDSLSMKDDIVYNMG